jgi:AcrR family transcriptional regulator
VTAPEPLVEAGQRRRRLEPDERRRQILSCAVRLFGERPYTAVSTTDVARAAGVARGLVNHYFGTKQALYVEVVRTLVTIPAFAADALPHGDLDTRVDAGVTWFLDVVSRHRRSWLSVMAAGGGQEPEVTAVLAEADEVTADTLLRLVGLDGVEHRREELRAMFRAYGGMGKAAAREWLEHGALDRAQVHRLLTTSLLAVVRSALPAAALTPVPDPAASDRPASDRPAFGQPAPDRPAPDQPACSSAAAGEG